MHVALKILTTSALFTWVGLALAHGPLDEQIANKTREIRQNPNRADLYLERGELHRHHEDWPAAMADYDTAAALDPELHVVDLARGKLMLDAGWYDRALPPLNRFLRRYPDNGDARLTRARVLVQLKRHLEAVLDFDAAIALLPRITPALFLERARALAAADRLEEALRSVDEGVKSLGGVVTLQLYAIELEVQLERYDAALERLGVLAARSARQEKWLMRRGEILLKAGRLSEARAALEQAREAVDALPTRLRDRKATRKLAARIDQALMQLNDETER